MTDRKPPTRHPSLLIADTVFAEINYAAYLRRLEPPMTIAEAASYSRQGTDRFGRPTVTDDASMRRAARSFEPLTRAYLRVLVDRGLIEVPTDETDERGL